MTLKLAKEVKLRNVTGSIGVVHCSDQTKQEILCCKQFP